jgi:hypothetical protein
MIGLWSGYSGTFLLALGIGSLLLLGLPLLFRPLVWADALRWSRPVETDLAVYFGRCLGAVICILSAAAILAARDQAIQPFFFQITIASFAFMVAIHGWGAIRRVQPWTETVEIGLWGIVMVVAVLCHPG